MGQRMLIVEDDRLLAEAAADYFTGRGWSVYTEENGARAAALLMRESFHLILLDVTLPGMDGFAVCREIRKVSEVPVVFITARVLEEDELNGYSLGADDYVTKPFRPLELIARVKAQLRRYNKYSPTQKQDMPATVLTYKKLSLNTQTYECVLDGEIVPLTPTEFSILRILLEKQGVVVSLEDLFHSVWKDEYYSKNSSTITVHIRHLREKLKDTAEKPKYIKTIWGVGYKI